MTEPSRDSRGVLCELGLNPPDDAEIRVHKSAADTRYFAPSLPPRGTDGRSKADLAKLVAREGMIGVTDPLPAIPQ